MADLQSELQKVVRVSKEERRPQSVAPSILALYNHEGWKAAHDQATVEWVIAKLNEPQDFELFDINGFIILNQSYVGRRFIEVLEQEIPYAEALTK